MSGIKSSPKDSSGVINLKSKDFYSGLLKADQYRLIRFWPSFDFSFFSPPAERDGAIDAQLSWNWIVSFYLIYHTYSIWSVNNLCCHLRKLFRNQQGEICDFIMAPLRFALIRWRIAPFSAFVAGDLISCGKSNLLHKVIRWCSIIGGSDGHSEPDRSCYTTRDAEEQTTLAFLLKSP